MINRVILIVMDSVGVGHLPDADRFNDNGTNTLLNIYRRAGVLKIPNLCALGLGKIVEVGCITPEIYGCYGKMGEQSSNKDMLKKIVASGDVKVVSEQYTAKTVRLEYDLQAQVLELSGLDSTITMGKNSIAGSKITYYRAKERFKVEGGSDKRVNAVFFSDGKVSDMFGDEEEKEKSKEKMY